MHGELLPTQKQLGHHHLGNRQSTLPSNAPLATRARRWFQHPTAAMCGRNSRWRRSSLMDGKLPDTRGPGVLSGRQGGFHWHHFSLSNDGCYVDAGRTLLKTIDEHSCRLHH